MDLVRWRAEGPGYKWPTWSVEDPPSASPTDEKAATVRAVFFFPRRCYLHRAGERDSSGGSASPTGSSEPVLSVEEGRLPAERGLGPDLVVFDDGPVLPAARYAQRRQHDEHEHHGHGAGEQQKPGEYAERPCRAVGVDERVRVGHVGTRVGQRGDGRQEEGDHGQYGEHVARYGLQKREQGAGHG